MEPAVFFSVIIPTYNRGALIVESIRSILDQRFTNIEVIVVDDGSTDDTESVVSGVNDSRVRYVRIRNQERGAARNRGKALARGRYVNFFDSDDVFYDILFDLHHFIEKEKYPSVVFGSIDILKEDGSVLKSSGRPYAGIKENLVFNNFLACGSVFLERKVADEFSFSEDRMLSGSEDWELWLRVFSKYDFTEAPFAVFKQRDHEDRSMREKIGVRVKTRELRFASCINDHRTLLMNRFTKSEINRLVADRFTLISLSLYIGGDKRAALAYWIKSFATSPLVILRKRFWAMGKKFISPWL